MRVLNGKIIYICVCVISILRYVYVIPNSKKYKYSACIFIQYKYISRD